MKAYEPTLLGLSINGVLEIMKIGELRVSQQQNIYRIVECRHYETGCADIVIKVLCFNSHAMLFDDAEEGQFMFASGKLQNAYQHNDDVPRLTLIATWAMPVMDANVPLQEEVESLKRQMLDEKKNGWKKTYNKNKITYEDWQHAFYPEDSLENDLDNLIMRNIMKG